MASVTPIPVPLNLGPAEAFLAWPRQVPVVALWSGSGVLPEDPAAEARWTILGIPSAWRVLPHGVSAADARAFLRGLAPFGGTSTAESGVSGSLALVPGMALVPGWFVRLSYELGEVLEPAAGVRGRSSGEAAAHRAGSAGSGWPLAEAARVDEALVYDHAERQWYAVGHVRRLVALVTDAPPHAEPFELEALSSVWGEAGYREGVSRAIELIHAGDCYQVNLAHAMRGGFRGSARSLFAALCRRAMPWHGAYMERDEGDGTRRALLSASPELFVSYDASSRTLSSRPMKGTRRAGGAASQRDLEASVKDHAELAMIVDMMRNDLGRSADLGSVRVDAPRRIEHHGRGAGAVLQATGQVSATLREGVLLGDAIADAFPAASVTGAPKIRAMQVIRELEPMGRDAYCGCVGMHSDRGNLAMNVAIRTAMIDGSAGVGPGRDVAPRDDFANATLTYHVGAGVVADSDPGAEWRETLDKAGHIAAVAAVAAGAAGAADAADAADAATRSSEVRRATQPASAQGGNP